MTELILLIFGGVVFTISFFLPSGRREDSEGISQLNEEQIKEIIDREVKQAKEQISDIVDETITYSMEKTERSMERLTNEKIMAVNEYSDTVLEQINKNHKEAVFLYDMLNDKHENLKNTVSEAVKTATEVKQTMKDAEITAKEAKEQADKIQGPANDVEAVNEPAVSVAPVDTPVKEFTPILAKRVEVIASPEEIRKEKEAVKPKKRTARKPKTETTAVSETENETTESKIAEKAEKAAKVDLSMAAPAKAGGRNSNERILELHKAGKSNMAIAKELGLGIGEVKLVIDLFEGI
ncbi:MAG: DUF6115 domain-containing protein [Suilimivivens sp.]